MASLFDSASLLFVASAYKQAKAYSCIPTNGDGDFVFARASPSSRIDSTGAASAVAVNVPALNFGSVDCLKGCGAFKVEDDATFTCDNIDTNEILRGSSGTLLIEGNIPDDSTNFIRLWDGTNDNKVALNQAGWVVRQSGSQVSNDASIYDSTGGRITGRIAVSWSGAGEASLATPTLLFSQGGATKTSSLSEWNDDSFFSEIQIDGQSATNDDEIKILALWDRALTQAELNTITAPVGDEDDCANDEQGGAQPSSEQVYYMNVRRDLDRPDAITYNAITDTLVARVNNQDQVGNQNSARIQGDFVEFTSFTFQVRIDSANITEAGDFFNIFDLHDPSQIAYERPVQNANGSGRSTSFRSPVSFNAFMDGGDLYVGVGIRRNGLSKEFICQTPLILEKWYNVSIDVVWGEDPDGSVVASVDDFEESAIGISTKGFHAHRLYPMWGIYQDGDIGDRGIESVVQLRNMRMGDSLSTFKVEPDFDRVDTKKQGEETNRGQQ